MATQTTMQLTPKFSPHLTFLLGELQALIDSLDAESAPLFEHIFDAVIERPELSNELFTIQGNGHPAGAGECVVVFEPGETLLRLLAALRARNPDLFGLVEPEAGDQ